MMPADRRVPGALPPVLGGETHLAGLTSVRGIACIAVLVGHTTQVVEFGPTAGPPFHLATELLRVTFNSHAAVMLFFVLSGCVLSLSLRRNPVVDGRGLTGFYIKRAFRLLPLLWVSVAVALGSILLLRSVPVDRVFAEWLALNLAAPVDAPHVGLALMGLFTRYNGPMWSLRTELVYSALLPFFFLALIRPRLRPWLLVALAALALAPLSERIGFHYGLFFALGAMIPVSSPLRWAGGRPGLILALVGLVFGRAVLEGLGATFKQAQLVEGLLAYLIVGQLYWDAGAARWLVAKPLLWLGDLSYSIYLLHLPVFLLLFGLGWQLWGAERIMADPTLTIAVLTGLTLVGTTLLAQLTYELVERPGQRLGRLLAGRVAVGTSGASGSIPGRRPPAQLAVAESGQAAGL